MQAELPHHGEVARLTVRIVGQPEGRPRDARLLGQLERRALPVGADQDDARRVEWIFRRLDQGLQVAAPARHQDANPEPAHSRIWTRRCSDATMSPTWKTSPSRTPSAVSALDSSTTTIIPIPMLKVRHISSSATKGLR